MNYAAAEVNLAGVWGDLSVLGLEFATDDELSKMETIVEKSKIEGRKVMSDKEIAELSSMAEELRARLKKAWISKQNSGPRGKS